MPATHARRRRKSRGRAALALGAVVGAAGLGLASCAGPPRPGTVDGLQRARSLDGAWPGLGAPAEIVWDDHLIPSVRAASPEDAAYALGLVHAHLRRAQMEVFRSVARGRIASVAGPLGVGIDEAIRALDLDRAVPRMEAALDDDTRRWLGAYVAGVNDHTRRARGRPADALALGFDYDEPWTVGDVLAIGRLLCVDLNWGRWLGVLPLRDEPGGAEFIERLWAHADDGLPSFGAEQRTDLSLLFDGAKSGSNAFVVSGERSASGGALVAGDPHLGLTQPNFWLAVGLRAPGLNAVGLSAPGAPFVLVGRNERIAWTGTNMQSSSSALYRLPEGWRPVAERRERIPVRWWFDAVRTIRESEWGPVLTDASMLRGLGEGDLALRWRGHDPSDEAGAFLGAARAESWPAFRAAFARYAVGGQNMLYGDADGNIGQILALEAVPAAARAGRTAPVPTDDPRYDWTPGVPSDELPHAFNPEAGFLVSANNTPVRTDPPLVPQGNANDRVARMTELLEGRDGLTLDDLLEIQLDTFSRASLEAARAIARLAGSGPRLSRDELALVGALAAWDGRYDEDSAGAVAYQLALDALIDRLYRDRYAPAVRAVIRGAPYAHTFVLEDVTSGDPGAADAVRGAVRAASRRFDPDRTWGDVHRLRLAHPIAMAPFVGRRYVFDEMPWPGSTTTVMKSAHGVTSGRHTTSFGANARVLFDMGGIDDNRVVLLGGQDGWIGSDRMLDQVGLFRDGGTVPLPLSREGQDARAALRTALTPGARRR